jgi:hypothetical protein
MPGTHLDFRLLTSSQRPESSETHGTAKVCGFSDMDIFEFGYIYENALESSHLFQNRLAGQYK